MSSPFPPREGPPPNADREWPTEILSPYEVDLLFEAKSRMHPSNEIRDQAILALMYRTGLKVGQIAALVRTGYNQPNRQLTVPRGKRSPEVITLDAESATALDDWITERRKLRIRSNPLFCPVLRETRGGPLRPGNIRHVIHARAARAGLDRRVNTEAVRQSGRKYLGFPGSISAFELHPEIGSAAAQLLADGHYDSAVRAGAIALRNVLREQSGLHDLDGVTLVSAALSADPPPILLADIRTKEGKNEQDGWAALARGCFSALRNSVAHRDVEYTRMTGMEALGTMSLIARRVSAPGTPQAPT